MKRPRIKDYKKDGNTYYHKSTKQNFEFDMSKYLNIVESGYRSQLKEKDEQINEIYKICHGWGDGDNYRRVEEIYDFIDNLKN